MRVLQYSQDRLDQLPLQSIGYLLIRDIGISVVGIEAPTVNFPHQDYSNQICINRREGRLIPPEDGWVSCSKQHSSQQAPKCHFLSALASSSAAATAVNELVVSGCGLTLANGTYKRTSRRCNGLPTYTKTAGQITFTISSIFNDKYQQWKINQNGWSNIIYKSNSNHRVEGKLDGAPLDNSTWSVILESGGVHPSPQVKRG